MRRTRVALALALWALALALPRARAEGEPPLAVVVDDAALAAELRQAVSDELHVPTTDRAAPGSAALFIGRAEGRLVVRYRRPDGSHVERSVPLPDAPRDVVRTSAWLAGNLVRDEATELLTQLRRSQPPTPVPSPNPNPSPNPSPSPRPTPSPTPRPTPTPSPTPSPNPNPSPSPSPNPNPTPSPCATAPLHPLHLSLFHPLATNLAAPSARAHASLGLLYAHLGELQGAQVGLVNAVRCRADGAQIGALANHVRGPVRGVQAASVFNVATGATRGAQIAGIVNVTEGPLEGVQGGAVNVAGDVSGVQLGVVNVAARVRGAQVGIVNFADDVDGASYALVPWSRTGILRPVVWASSTMPVNAGLMFDTRRAYTQVGGGVRSEVRSGARTEVFAMGVTLGAHLLRPERGLTLDVDVGYAWLLGRGLRGGEEIARGRAVVGYRFAPRFAVFVGGGAFLETGPDPALDIVDSGPELSGGLAF